MDPGSSPSPNAFPSPSPSPSPPSPQNYYAWGTAVYATLTAAAIVLSVAACLVMLNRSYWRPRRMRAAAAAAAATGRQGYPPDGALHEHVSACSGRCCGGWVGQKDNGWYLADMLWIDCKGDEMQPASAACAGHAGTPDLPAQVSMMQKRMVWPREVPRPPSSLSSWSSREGVWILPSRAARRRTAPPAVTRLPPARTWRLSRLGRVRRGRHVSGARADGSPPLHWPRPARACR
ncbi:hypothetical protein ACKKBG_A06065 [Auxenochlorella protothecoides x Auxenochlorella symbiontica]